MSTPEDDGTESDVEQFSSEYAQALEAFLTIKEKSSALVMMGNQDQLTTFLDQFELMAADAETRARASSAGTFGDRFAELRARAERLRADVLPPPN